MEVLHKLFVEVASSTIYSLVEAVSFMIWSPDHGGGCFRDLEIFQIVEVSSVIGFEEDDTSLEIPSNLNPTHGTEPKKEHKILSDEADLHPAESSNLNPTHGTEPKKEHKILSDKEDLDPADSDRTTEHVAQNMSEDKSDQVKEADHPEKEHKSDIVEDQNKVADQIDKRMTSIIVKMKALGSELEDLVKYDKIIENIRAKMEAVTSEVEAATKHV
ncbi:hypothetical protein LWI28_002055 [Acer negundo]|uniref:Uncharacterized protein n=1 Tax=Acer negundo TaxID=4023 RepID=A0AAD5NW78_ACENE|nr:hypothetical protein LWI28_002055 [Acer negundo]